MASRKNARSVRRKVTYKKDELLKPRQIKSPEDYRPGTTKGKIDAHDIWVVTIKMPKELIGNFKHGIDEIEVSDDGMTSDQGNLNATI